MSLTQLRGHGTLMAVRLALMAVRLAQTWINQVVSKVFDDFDGFDRFWLLPSTSHIFPSFPQSFQYDDPQLLVVPVIEVMGA